VSDTFVDSSWYFLRYPCTEFDDRAFDRSRVAKVLPVDFYAGGPEHVQRHHLYARFVTMALHDLGFVHFDEPFPRIRLGGIIVHQGAKMSKSRGNVVTPDDYVTRHGADVLRCARLWRLVENAAGLDPPPAVMARVVHDVTAAVERMRFNVALARLMEFASQARSHKAQSVLVRLLAPLAPHLAEELWARLGAPFSVHEQPWPDHDDLLLTDDSVDFVVQVDGTKRGVVRLSSEASEDEVLVAARALAAVRSALEGRDVTRVVFVAGRLINFVTKEVRRSM
jgi:leucyl-tRNA synthetase